MSDKPIKDISKDSLILSAGYKPGTNGLTVHENISREQAAQVNQATRTNQIYYEGYVELAYRRKIGETPFFFSPYLGVSIGGATISSAKITRTFGDTTLSSTANERTEPTAAINTGFKLGVDASLFSLALIVGSETRFEKDTNYLGQIVQLGGEASVRIWPITLTFQGLAGFPAVGSFSTSFLAGYEF